MTVILVTAGVILFSLKSVKPFEEEFSQYYGIRIHGIKPPKRLAAHLQIDTKEISLTLQEFIERRIHRQRVDSGVQRTTRVSVPFVERHVNAPSPHQQVSSSEDLTSRIAATIDEKLPNYFQLSEHDWGSRPC